MSIVALRSRLISTVVGLSVLAGVHYARAAAIDQKSTETMVPSIMFLAAELDPVFQQKLVRRIRGPYERSHPLNLWAFAD